MAVKRELYFPDEQTARLFEVWFQREGAARFQAVANVMPRVKRVHSTVVGSGPDSVPDGGGDHHLLPFQPSTVVE